MAKMKYRLAVTSTGVLIDSISTFSVLANAIKAMEKIAEDPRSRRADDWLVLVDRETGAVVRSTGRGRRRGSALPEYKAVRHVLD